MVDPAFFVPSRVMTVAEIAEFTGAEVADPSHKDRTIDRLADPQEAGEGALAFVEGVRWEHLIDKTNASAVMCTAELAGSARPETAVLICKSPRRAFAAIGRELYPESTMPTAVACETGLSEFAHVHDTAEIEDNVTIEAGAVVGKGASIGRGTVIGPNVVVGASCKIGRDCYVGPGTGIRVALIGDRVLIHGGCQIGSDGFGYVFGDRGHEKIPQIGRVIIQDDVEIGANTTIDRGALSDTVIGAGTKIDNLVQIGHNVGIGRLCLIAAQTGLSGSVKLGDFAALGGQVGVGDQVSIGTGARVAGKSGVSRDVGAGEAWFGYPARPAKEAYRQFAVLSRLARQAKSSNGGRDD